MNTRLHSFLVNKPSMSSLVLAVGICSAAAQGLVDFRNNQTDFPTSGVDRRVYNIDGSTPLVGTNFQARLLYGSDAASLQPATYTTPSRFNNVTTGATRAGTWIGGNRTLTGFAPGSSVSLQVQVWDAGPGATGRTFDEAAAAGLFACASLVFSYTVPPAGTLNPQPYYMDNLRSIQCIPEPSVIALGVVGLAGALLLRNRHSRSRKL
jgi:hypothetical protein